MVVFFFSSRRRHTRYIGDWSSDVCSSDLVVGKHYVSTGAKDFGKWSKQMVDDFGEAIREHLQPVWDKLQLSPKVNSLIKRSEERRVGKECRSWCGREN